MPNYQYTVLHPDGKKTKQTMSFESERELRNAVQKNGNLVIEIKDTGAWGTEIDISKPPKAKELGVFCTQVHSILQAGVPAIEAFGMVLKTTSNKKLKKALNDVIDEVNSGMFISDALNRHTDVFPVLMIQMIKAGEASGQLTNIFQRLGKQFEKEAQLKNTMKKALAYPKMIVLVVCLALVVVCAYVMPMFADIFKDMGTDLPFTTKIFLGLSDLFTSKWYIMLTIIVTLFIVWKLFANSKQGKRILAAMKLKMPLIKDLTVKTESANFARVFSTLLSSGKDYPSSLEITEHTMGNVFFQEAVSTINEEVKQGKTLTSAMKDVKIFPELLVSMCDIGENTGKVGEMIENAADYFEDETETATVKLTSALQPIIMIFLGIFVGMMVYSIYTPMFSMYQGIG